MRREVESVYALPVTAQTFERQSLDDLVEAERGVVFISAAPPPRVGSRVQVDVTVDGDAGLRLPALVVWSRPARPGIAAGFRAQLQDPPEALLDHLRNLTSSARSKLIAKTEAKRSNLDRPVEERVSSREPTAPIRMAQRNTPLPNSIPAPSLSPLPPPVPSRTPTQPSTTPSSHAAFSAPPKAPQTPAPTFLPPLPTLLPGGPAGPPETTNRQRVQTPDPPTTAQLSFSSPRNFLLHFAQFLEHGEVYITDAKPPAVGTPVNVTIHVPDGDEPLEVTGAVKRLVSPPEVPEPGWVALFDDPDGAASERLATASFIVSAPTLPGSRPPSSRPPSN